MDTGNSNMVRQAFILYGSALERFTRTQLAAHGGNGGSEE